MKYFSMFSGIGGFELGIELSNIDAECVGYSEVDKYAISIYQRHFPDHKGFGDATKIRTEELPDFDLLVGGFPCQSFSVAGKRGGFKDTRGTLFFELARVLRDKRPRYFLFENVKNLLSHDSGKTFQTILKVLADLGYDVQWSIYNSKNYVPQNRERIYLKGYLRGQCGREILHQSREGEENNGKLIKLNKRAQAQTVYDPNGISCCLSANGGGDGGKTGLYKIDVKDYPWFKGVQVDEKKFVPTTQNGDAFAVTTRPRAMPFSKKQDNYVCDIDKNEERFDYRIRRLIPLECERLQGLPDHWTKYGADGELISDTQRYKCCGNAVTTHVVTHCINEMFE